MDTSQKFNIAINRLDEMRSQWHDIKRALENATLGDWTSLWPEKNGKGNGTVQHEQVACGNCTKPITGAWSQSPKGRVCDPCWTPYHKEGSWN